MDITTELTTVRKIPTVIELVRSFADFGENWDSYHAEAIHPKAIDAAITYLSLLPHSVLDGIAAADFDAFPTTDGGVGIEIGDLDIRFEYTGDDA